MSVADEPLKQQQRGPVTCARVRDPQAPDLNRVHRVNL